MFPKYSWSRLIVLVEKLHIIVKENIEYIRLHYLDELQEIFNVEDDNKHRKVGIYE